MNERVYRVIGVEFAVSFLLICGAVTSSVIAIVVIAIPLVAPLIGSKPYVIPKEVGEWGGVIIGFYFGAFVTFAATVWKSRRESENDKA